ncbi:TetR/AcrR family transcriptional regulator [Pseudooceanicola sp. MF1-13]|uniref:TetR/AcrR family transcriptional regulator n=1 Tax=Pseudooceanicola sp. MF1-13 TaxID=3379095 RepID=UPI0038922015
MSIVLHPSLSARDRLIETARVLFLRHGVPHIGINRVIDEANVARMTLYNHFPSKDALVAAVYEQEAELRRQSILTAQAAHDTPVAKVSALFDIALELAREKGFRGCAFVNLAIETAAADGSLHALAKAHKEWIRANVLDCLPSEMFADPATLARQVVVLWDGGIVGAYVTQSVTPIKAARDAAQALMRAAAS